MQRKALHGGERGPGGVSVLWALHLSGHHAHLPHGGAVQVDPGFMHLTPRLLSALETKL